ncbi:MAG: hypothetical protein HXX08_11405 [Chloroflexi bacterium]|uniref:Uncharacterized protein n=1 Tax=Candidatus Chlorohelix allophototropha TaxID=3003348 RepID=A0A8T7M3E1_9CHLR|nr:hypothetical protein [Chloroflexota bacterium]WJW65844.1 hypothetical protein OZ401_001623 [Chloroflexota bacterium L227-S17]
MAIGSRRQTNFINESAGWGAINATVQTASIATATSLLINNTGGATYGVPNVAVGMTVYFQDGTGEPPRLISAITGTTVLTLTVPAMTFAHAVNAAVWIDYAPNTALLLSSLSVNRNPKNWSDTPYSGTRAKNIFRVPGRLEVTGTMGYMLRPNVNVPILVKAFGQDNQGVIGTVPGTPVTTTLNGATTVGATTVIVTSATGLIVNTIIQIDTGTSAECRKITNVATNTLTLDVALNNAHANSVAVAKVIAPYTHTIPSASSNLDSIILEDYVPYDDSTQTTKITTNSYFIPGIIFSKLTVNAPTTTGIQISADFTAQDKQTNTASSGIAIPNEATFTFNQESVLVNGTQNMRVTVGKFDFTNDPQSRYTKSGTLRPFAIKAGMQEAKGELDFYEDAATQATFWANFTAATPLALIWKVIDSIGEYIQIAFPKIVLDTWSDGDFSPADLIDAKSAWTAQLDSGASNVQATLTVANAQYLPY